MTHDTVLEREQKALLDRAYAACVLCVHHGDGPGPCRDCLGNLLLDATLVGAYLAARAMVHGCERGLFKAELHYPHVCTANSALRRGYETALVELRDYRDELAAHLAHVKNSGPSLGPCTGDA